MFDRSKRDSRDENNFPTIDTTESPRPRESRTARTGEAAVIGPSIRINGDLSGEEDLVIQGTVQGTIQLKEKSLTVGADGKVDANVLAHTVIVEGKVNGDLFGSESVTIRKSGNVLGNIVSPRVGLEEGCRFKGSIDMDEAAVKQAFGTSASTSPGKSGSTASKPAVTGIGGSGANDTNSEADAGGIKSGSAT